MTAVVGGGVLALLFLAITWGSLGRPAHSMSDPTTDHAVSVGEEASSEPDSEMEAMVASDFQAGDRAVSRPGSGSVQTNLAAPESHQANDTLEASSSPRPTLPATSALMDDEKPVLVAAADANQLLGIVEIVSRFAGSPSQSDLLRSLAKRVRSRPSEEQYVGLAAFRLPDDQQLHWFGFLPHDDLEGLLDTLQPLIGYPREHANGIYEIRQPIPLYLRQAGRRIDVSTSESQLSRPPMAPLARVSELQKQCDVGVRLSMHNLPSDVINAVTQAMDAGFQAQLDMEPNATQRQIRQLAGRQQLRELEKWLTDSDELSMGWKTISSTGDTRLNFRWTATPGSELSRQFAAPSISRANSRYRIRRFTSRVAWKTCGF